MINIALVEDDRHLSDSEVKYITQAWALDEKKKITVFRTAEDFMKGIQVEFDVLIADIELPGMSGIELVKRLREQRRKIYVIFLTAHTGFSLESYRLEAYQYILKNEMEDRLPKVLNELGERIISGRKHYRVFIEEGDTLKIYFDDILYFSKEGKYVKYVIESRESLRERISLDEAFRESGGFPFLKIERGFIINARHMVSLSGDMIKMDNGDRLPVSRRMLPGVKKMINLNRSKL